MRKTALGVFVALFLAVGCGSVARKAVDSDFTKVSVDADDEDRPFLAIWRRDDGFRAKSEAPYLRIAIWNDGRVLFAKDPSKWEHNLRKGKITAERVAQLKEDLLATGVFELKGNCYLVPDAPCDCMMIDLGDKKQMLYWDEVETPGYGINAIAKPHHLKFKECWKAVNRLALAARSENSEQVQERFERPPEAWYVKKAIASE